MISRIVIAPFVSIFAAATLSRLILGNRHEVGWYYGSLFVLTNVVWWFLYVNLFLAFRARFAMTPEQRQQTMRGRLTQGLALASNGAGYLLGLLVGAAG